jgi:pyruvate/2-oxoglutarate dehydrogenase complex dihydrolipoamide dehydrogenase (E3) component
MMSGVKYEEITNEGLIITTKEGNKLTLQADTILPAVPLMPNTDLLNSLKGKVSEIYLIGDCREPRLIPDAIADGWKIAMRYREHLQIFSCCFCSLTGIARFFLLRLWTERQSRPFD